MCGCSGFRGAVEGALLGIEREAILQRPCEIHELWAYCSNGKTCTFLSVQLNFICIAQQWSLSQILNNSKGKIP